MRIIDASGPIENGMWSYGPPFPDVMISQVPFPEWLAYRVYSEQVTMALQNCTYLETGAHMYPEVMKIHEVPLERCFMVDTVVLQVPKRGGEGISVDDLQAALGRAGETLRVGDALLVATGWDSHWYKPDFMSTPPYFLAQTIYWILDQGVGLLGSDTPRYDNPSNPQNFFPEFFKHDILLLAPLVNLTQVRHTRVKLIALPIKFKGCCASPVRALIIEE
jgi:arylformamidase